MTVILVAAAASLLTLVLAIFYLASGWEERRRLAARSALDDAERRANSLLSRLDVRLRRTEVGRAVAHRIAASGLHVRTSTFLLVMSTVGVLAVIGVGTYLAPLFGVGAAFLVGLAFFSYLRRREDRRKEAFIAQLPELARVLSNATSAGLALRTAVEMGAAELEEPARSELRRTADALRLGQPFDEALDDLGRRLPSRELSVLISTLIVASRSGGSLVTALRTISSTLEDRKEIRREVKTIMGEAVVTNWSIATLGVGSLVVVNVVEPGILRTMSTQLIGQIILAIAGTGFVLSLIIIRRITRVDL
ncbi:MAG TPA: type II secretion system F family protein [Streptosporangiaceae bacterium]|jgi:tight adherence protein B